MRWSNNMKRVSKYIVILYIVISVFFIKNYVVLAENVSINIVVANPSESEKQNVPVEYKLPPNLSRKDIIDIGPFTLDYEVSSSSYYVKGNFELEPAETKKLKVIIKDVWKVPDEEVNDILHVLDKRLYGIKDAQKKQSFEILANTLKTRLNSILDFQKNNANNINARMTMYSANLAKLQDIKKSVFAPDALKDLKEEEKVETSLAVLVIEAANVMDTSSEMPIKYYLPREVQPHNVKDAAGFDVKYDPVLDQFYLFNELLFGPKETKIFNVQIDNVWLINQDIINKHITEAVDINKELAKTDFAEASEKLLLSINKKAETIIESQKNASDVKDYIAIYRFNQQLLNEIEDDINEMRNLLAMKQMPASDNIVENLTANIRFFKTFKEIADRFNVERVKPYFIWKIIMMIVIFVLILTAVFYGMWTLKLKKEEKKKYERVQ